MLACGQAGWQNPPCLALAVFQAHIALGSARAQLPVMFRLERLGTRIVDLIHRTRHIETLHQLSCGHWRCMSGHTTARVRRSRLSKLREYCNAIAVPGYRITSVTRDAPGGEVRCRISRSSQLGVALTCSSLDAGARLKKLVNDRRPPRLFRRCRTISGDPDGESAESS